MSGTIRKYEAKQVAADLMKARKVPRGIWNITPSGDLVILIGFRTVSFSCKAGHTFYSLKRLTEDIEKALDDLDRHRQHSRQIDLEECIRRASA